MRKALAESLMELAERDKRVVVLTADLGFMVLDEFAERFPDRFVNVGVAEANMLGLAAGMAREGLIPYCYSIATFASMRGYEQLRVGAALHQLPVRIVGIGGGFSYGTAGITHHALEDYAIMRCQPGVGVVAPICDQQTRDVLLSTYDSAGPFYYRIGKDPLELPHQLPRFELGEVYVIARGRVMLVATGSASSIVVDSAAELTRRGVSAGICYVPTLSPAHREGLLDAIRDAEFVVSVEDHYVNGGLGSLLAERIAEDGVPVRLLRRGVASVSDGITGSESFMRRRHGLDAQMIADDVQALLGADR